MKKTIITTAFIIAFVPSLALAQWWNPKTWFANSLSTTTEDIATTTPAIDTPVEPTKCEPEIIEKEVEKIVEKVVEKRIVVPDTKGTDALKLQLASKNTEIDILKRQILALDKAIKAKTYEDTQKAQNEATAIQNTIPTMPNVGSVSSTNPVVQVKEDSKTLVRQKGVDIDWYINIPILARGDNMCLDKDPVVTLSSENLDTTGLSVEYDRPLYPVYRKDDTDCSRHFLVISNTQINYAIRIRGKAYSEVGEIKVNVNLGSNTEIDGFPTQYRIVVTD